VEQNVLWCLWVSYDGILIPVSCAFDIFGQPPLILFDPITLPAYQIFQLISEKLAVKMCLLCILDLSLITWWRGILLYAFSYGVSAVGSQ